MQKYLVMVSNMQPAEFDSEEDALQCQKDYERAGHKTKLFVEHKEDSATPAANALHDMMFNGIDEHVMETFGPIPPSMKVQPDKIDFSQLLNDKIELDPHGTNPHAPGAKLDAGKNRAGLVLGGFADALWEVSKVGTYGANKYTEDGWKSVPNAKARYLDALYRHMLRAQSGELYDPDTHLLHLAHVAWNALAILHFEIISEDIPF